MRTEVLMPASFGRLIKRDPKASEWDALLREGQREGDGIPERVLLEMLLNKGEIQVYPNHLERGQQLGPLTRNHIVTLNRTRGGRRVLAGNNAYSRSRRRVLLEKKSNRSHRRRLWLWWFR